MTTPAAPIELFQVAPAFGVPSPSPFCVKVEAWLRVTATPYRVHAVFNPARGPKGKIPWVRLEGRLLGDSELILDALTAATGHDLDAGLGARERADATAYRVMVEEHLYWAIVHERWCNPALWPRVRDAFFAGIAPGVRELVAAWARRQVRAQLAASGLGRHAPAEIVEFARRDLDALAAFLGDKTYLLGDRMCRADTSIFATLTNLVDVELDGPICALARGRSNLVAYAQRLRRELFPAPGEAGAGG